MQKLTGQNGEGRGAYNENLGPCTKLHQKCMFKSSGWPQQHVPIYFSIIIPTLFNEKHTSMRLISDN